MQEKLAELARQEKASINPILEGGTAYRVVLEDANDWRQAKDEQTPKSLSALN